MSRLVLSPTECKDFAIKKIDCGRYQGRADLHLHSRYSNIDSYNPQLLVRGAEALGLEAIALTDHLNLHGSRIAQAYVKEQGFQVRVITGVEIICGQSLMPTERLLEKLGQEYETREQATQVAGDRRFRETHVLGYLFDPDHQAITAIEEKMISRKIEILACALRIINKTLKQKGKLQEPLGLSQLSLEEGIPPNRRHLYRLLETSSYRDILDRKEIDSIMREAVEESGGYLDMEVQAAIDLIHSAGGLAFLAHPLIGNVVKFCMGLYTEKSHQTRWDIMIRDFGQHRDFFGELFDDLAANFRSLGGDGAEIIHSDYIYMAGAVAMVKDIAANRGLKMSGGSDFHAAKGHKYYKLTMPVYVGIAPPDRANEEHATLDVNTISSWAKIT